MKVLPTKITLRAAAREGNEGVAAKVNIVAETVREKPTKTGSMPVAKPPVKMLIR